MNIIYIYVYIYIYTYDIRYVDYDMSRLFRASGEHCGEVEEQQLQEALKAHSQDTLEVGMRCAVLHKLVIQYDPIKSMGIDGAQGSSVETRLAVALVSDRCCRYSIPSPSGWRHLVMPSSPWRGCKVAKVALGEIP